MESNGWTGMHCFIHPSTHNKVTMPGSLSVANSRMPSHRPTYLRRCSQLYRPSQATTQFCFGGRFLGCR